MYENIVRRIPYSNPASNQDAREALTLISPGVTNWAVGYFYFRNVNDTLTGPEWQNPGFNRNQRPPIQRPVTDLGLLPNQFAWDDRSPETAGTLASPMPEKSNSPVLRQVA
jgi:hypothetical protein